MKALFYLLLVVMTSSACAQNTADPIKDSTTAQKGKYNNLTEQERRVLLEKATDRAFTGDYYDKTDKGVYVCKQCNNRLYSSEDKFESHCGWPSFDDEIDGSVIRVPDADGMRTEIICSNCKGHLGHVFLNEGFTDKETRHCVNTSSIQFYPSNKVKDIPAVIK